MKNAFGAAALLAALAVSATAETYRVGPGEEVTKISAIADKLAARRRRRGDGRYRGLDDTRQVRHRREAHRHPRRGRQAAQDRLRRREKRHRDARRPLHIREPRVLQRRQPRHLPCQSHDITVRDCYFENNHNGILGADSENTGDIRIEYCEFNQNGNGIYGHQIYLASWKPGAQSIVQFNYFHDSKGGVNIKTRMPRNIIRYNWIEAANNYECDLVDSDQGPGEHPPDASPVSRQRRRDQ